jgi:hypothetical protein
VLLPGHRVLRGQPFGALRLGLRALNGGARPREVGLQTIDLSLERTRVDLEEQIAASDNRSLAEAHARHQPGHARPDGDGVDGFEPAGELIPLGHLPERHLCHADLWRGRLTGLRGRPRAPGERQDRQE